MILDQTMLRRFEEQGFLVFDTGLSAAEIALLRATLVRLHENKAGFEQGAAFDALGLDDGAALPSFPQILHPRSFAPELMGTRFFHMARDIAKQLLGPDVRFKADISLMKPARYGGPTPWHQDEAFQDPAFEYQEVSFWLALQPTGVANSCMAYIPESHKGPVLPHGFPNNDPRIHALECVSGFDPATAVECPLPAGGCVIHNGRTVHGAGPNVSDQDRLAYVLIFDRVPVPAREHRTFPWRDRQQTARAERERAWRRQGGLLVHLWRQRSRIRVTSLRTLAFDMRRAARAAWRLALSS